MAGATTSKQVRALARETFGFERLRPGQAEAVAAVLDGRDTLAVLPTGSGKSAIYQMAGVRMPGPTVVVSPLIALQRDQAESIEDRNLATAAVINSARRAAEVREAFDDLRGDDLEFVFLAPEQFANDEVLARIRAARPSLFVVDEAHCVSDWGHDFRPEYLQLGAIAEELGHPVILALTATASPPVRQEIIERLGLRDPRVVVRGFDRPEIWLGVEWFTTEDQKRAALIERFRETPGAGILYAGTRRTAEEIAMALEESGRSAAAYHAGLRPGERNTIQEQFMSGESEVIVATTAFGMGIDKRDVRFVYHYDIPGSLDSYYQEVGRAGRDGEPAKGVLFYRAEDLGLRRYFAGTAQVPADELELVAEIVHEHGKAMDPRDIREQAGLSDTRLATALHRLEDAGAIRRLKGGKVAPVKRRKDDLAALAEEAADAQERRRAFDRSRVDMMRGYAEGRECRRTYLLTYFGEEFEPPCDNCDNCDAGLGSNGDDEGHRPFPLQSRVRHAGWGEGTVVRYENGDRLVVLFDEAGYRTLGLDLVAQNDLLEPFD